tara:strand:- start:265 stop:519 length:255 start_codon:yes stop_codon:yes gene_type:complete
MTSLLKLILPVLVFFHALIISVNVAACFVAPFLCPWYLWVPICTIVARVVTGGGVCPLTVLENKIRIKLGMDEISGFVAHYLLK